METPPTDEPNYSTLVEEDILSPSRSNILSSNKSALTSSPIKEQEEVQNAISTVEEKSIESEKANIIETTPVKAEGKRNLSLDPSPPRPASPQRPISNEIIIPETFVRVISKAVHQRVKIMNVLAIYFDDFMENEIAMTKSLTRLGGQYNSNLGLRIDWFQSVLQLIDELIQKTLIQNACKLHQSFSQQILSASIKLFREIFKSYPQNIQQKLTYCLSLVEELKRAKVAHLKNIDKYTKLIRDTESQLRARENILAANAVEANNNNNSSNEGGGGGGGPGNDHESANALGTPSTSGTTANGQDRFMGRSFSKMLSKMNVTSNNTAIEKKIEERCRELFKEIDIAERQLSANAESLNNYRTELITTAKRTIQELFETEFARLSAFKDGLSSFTSHYELLIVTLLDAITHLSSQFSVILTETEKPQLVNYLIGQIPLVEVSHPTLFFITSTPEIVENFVADKTEITIWFLRLGRLTDAYEYIFTLTQRASSLLEELNEVDKTYSKNLHIVFDKNGFQKQPAETSIYAIAKYNLVNSSIHTCGQLISTFELPQMKKVFELAILTLNRMNDTVLKTLESMNDEVVEQFQRIFKRLTSTKKDLIDKSMGIIKKLEVQFLHLSKSRVELKKLKGLLRERRLTLKAARDEITVQNPSAPTNHHSSFDNARDSINTDASDVPRINSTGSAIAAPATNTGSLMETAVSSEAVEDTTEESGGLGRRQSSILGATLSTVKLKQAVGFESAADRVVRIENQINNLEEKEVELTSRCDQLQKSLLADVTSTKTEMESLYNGSLETLMSLLFEVKSVLDLISKLQLSKYQSFRDSIRTLKESVSKLTIADDVYAAKRLYNSLADIETHSPGQTKDHYSADLIEIPVIEPFKPMINPIVIEGKMKLIQNAHQNPALLAIVAELKIQKEKEAAAAAAAITAAAAAAAAAAAVSSNTTAAVPSSTLNLEPLTVNTAAPTLEAPASPSVSPEKASTIGLTPPTSPGSRNRKSSSFDASKEIGEIEITESADSLRPDDASTDNNDAKLQKLPSETTADARGQPSSKKSTDSTLSKTGSTASATAPQPDFELKKFGLTINDKVLESFSCALYPKKGILTHGRMYITQHYIAFSGWPDTRVLLSMKNVENIVKCNTLMYIPNAISIHMSDKTEYFFASFIDRDFCCQLLINLTTVERRICELAGPDGAIDPPHLVFGYQHRSTILKSTREDLGDDEDTEIGAEEDDDSGDGELNESENEGSEGEHVQQVTDTRDPANNSLADPITGDLSSPMKLPPPNNVFSTFVQSPAAASTTSIASAFAENYTNPFQQIALPVAPIPPPRKKNPLPAPKVQSIYEVNGISQIAKKTVKGTAADIWQHFWKKSSGYRDFLASTGDITKSCSEWKYASNQPITVSEDRTKTNYQYERDFDYDHARTTMLMFGPKMAPTKLKQFISLYNEEEMEEEEWKSLHEEIQPKSMIILCLSFCEGVPMADVFKVLQYWTFTTLPDYQSCEITIGFSVHYIKSSMFKSQISGGAKDEMTKQIDDFLKYLPNFLAKQRAAWETTRAITASSSFLSSTGTINGTTREGEVAAIAASVEELFPAEKQNNNIVIITTSDETSSTPSHLRQSRRLSFGNKSVTITTESDGATATFAERVQAWTFYGLDLKTIIFLVLILLILWQLRMIRSLSSEVKDLKALVLEQIALAHNQNQR